MTQTRAYVPTSDWRSLWSRKRVRMCVVEVEIMRLPSAVCHQPSVRTADGRWQMARSPWIQDLVDPGQQIDDMRPRRAVACPRQRGPERGLQVDQLEPSLGARIGRTRWWEIEARERREAGRQRGHERRADEPLHLIDEGALQVAAILIDPHRTAAELSEGAAPHVAEQICDRVRSPRRLRRRLLGEP